MTIFDILKDIITTKRGDLHKSPDFSKVYSNYILARYLSMKTEYINFACWLNQYGDAVGKENSYKFLVLSLPKNRNSFITYIKPKKEEKEDVELSDS